jgi:hypothetical protein
MGPDGGFARPTTAEAGRELELSSTHGSFARLATAEAEAEGGMLLSATDGGFARFPTAEAEGELLLSVALLNGCNCLVLLVASSLSARLFLLVESLELDKRKPRGSC